MNVLSIEVTADIYRNYFDDGQPYYYDNIKAVIESEQEVLERTLEEMYNLKSPLFAENQPFCSNNRIEPVEENAKLILDIKNMTFKKMFN